MSSTNAPTPAPKLIFSCSGGSDVAELADRAARRLTREGKGKMYCLAGVAAGIEPVLKNTKAAPGIVVIDGCPVQCASKVMQKAGFEGFKQVAIADLGLKKHESPATEENIAKVIAAGAKALAE